MADGNNGMNMVARRSARVFENDVDIRKIEDAVSDNGAGYNRKAGDREDKTPERDNRVIEELIRTRTSSTCSLTQPDDDSIRGFQISTRSNSEEASNTVQDGIVKKPKIPGRPRNFGTVIPGIYRSGYPEAEDHEFLKDLGLKTIVTLVDKDYPEGYQMFMQSNGINHVVIKMDGTKKVEIPRSVMNSIMDVVSDPQNHPLLLHCNQGRHRTGCTVAVIRMAMGWSAESIVSEYTSYAHPKVREVDVNYIRSFEIGGIVGIADPKFARSCSFSKPRAISRSNKVLRFAVFTIFVFAVCGMTILRSRVA